MEAVGGFPGEGITFPPGLQGHLDSPQALRRVETQSPDILAGSISSVLQCSLCSCLSIHAIPITIPPVSMCLPTQISVVVVTATGISLSRPSRGMMELLESTSLTQQRFSFPTPPIPCQPP